MKTICTTWFLPEDYCGCAKCTGKTPPPIVGAGEMQPATALKLFDLEHLGEAFTFIGEEMI